MALREGSGELHPALLKYGIVGIVPAVFRVEIPTAALHGAELHGADGIIQRTEGLARPVIEPARGIVEALPCGEVLIADAGGGGKAVEAAAVAIRSCVDLETGKISSLPSSAVPSERKPGMKSESSSGVNCSSQGTRLSSPSSSASMMWQVKRSGIYCTPLPPLCASFR